MAKSWWAKRWIKVLRLDGSSSRFSRGRAYAREGRVVSIEVEKGLVTAAVQGSRKRPYSVEIRVDCLSEPQWKRVIQVLGSEARFLAGILSGDISEEAEGMLTREGVSLFPISSREIHASCTCPDWANPCKHIVAVYYTLANLLDDDPGLVFTLRGKSIEELMTLIRRNRVGGHIEALPEDGCTAGGLCSVDTTQVSSLVRYGIRDDDETADSSPGGDGGDSGSAVSDMLSRWFSRKHEAFWKMGPNARPEVKPGVRPSGGHFARRETWKGIAIPLPPLPFKDKDFLSRRILEEVYELASKRAKEIK